jgi:hypothetical protein
MNARPDGVRLHPLDYRALRIWAADLRDGPGSLALKADAIALASVLDASDHQRPHLTLGPQLWAAALRMATALSDNHRVTLPDLGGREAHTSTKRPGAGRPGRPPRHGRRHAGHGRLPSVAPDDRREAAGV